MAVVVLVGMLLSLCAATLNRAYQVHHAALTTFRELEQIQAWCERFRTDAHQAASATIDTQVEFQREGGEIVRYVVEGEQLLRISERDSQIVSREAWHGPRIAEVRWSRSPIAELPWIRCDISFADSELALEPIVCFARLLKLIDRPNSEHEHAP